MAWLAVHPDNTIKVRVPDEEGAPVFEIGFWPPKVSERVSAVIAAMSKGKAEIGTEEFIEKLDLNFDNQTDMIAYGVRGWSGFALPDGQPVEAKVVKEAAPGPRLDEESLRVLYFNKLRGALAVRCYLFNVLSEEEKKTFDWQRLSGPSGSPTAAPSVSPDSKGSPKSSDSKDAP